MGMADVYGQRMQAMSHPWTNVSGPVIRMGSKEVTLQDLVNERNKVVAYLCSERDLLQVKLDRAERALKRAGYQDLGAQEWKPPLGLSVQAIRNAWLDAEVVGNSWDGAKAVHDLYLSVKRSVDEKCPKCFDTGTIMMIGGPAQACDCKTEISTSKAFQMEPGTRSRDEDVMESVDQVEALARVLREACADHCKYDAVGLDFPVFIAEARAAIAHLQPIKCIFCDFKGDSLASLKEHSAKCEAHPLNTRPEGLPTAEELAQIYNRIYYGSAPEKCRVNWESIPEACREDMVRGIDAVLDALRPWLRDPVGWEMDVGPIAMLKAFNAAPKGGVHRNVDDVEGMKAVLDLCRSRIKPVYECDCSAIEKERDLLKVEYESRQITINNVRAALEGRPFKNTLEGE